MKETVASRCQGATAASLFCTFYNSNTNGVEINELVVEGGGVYFEWGDLKPV